jgi:hypothetical protein
LKRCKNKIKVVKILHNPNPKGHLPSNLSFKKIEIFVSTSKIKIIVKICLPR